MPGQSHYDSNSQGLFTMMKWRCNVTNSSKLWWQPFPAYPLSWEFWWIGNITSSFHCIHSLRVGVIMIMSWHWLSWSLFVSIILVTQIMYANPTLGDIYSHTLTVLNYQQYRWNCNILSIVHLHSTITLLKSRLSSQSNDCYSCLQFISKLNFKQGITIWLLLPSTQRSGVIDGEPSISCQNL